MSREPVRLLVAKAAALLKEEGAAAVYAFGSAARRADDAADIDLAVTGLPPERFFRAMGRAADVLDRPLDLVDLDEPTPFTRYLKEHTELERVA